MEEYGVSFHTSEAVKKAELPGEGGYFEMVVPLVGALKVVMVEACQEVAAIVLHLLPSLFVS